MWLFKGRIWLYLYRTYQIVDRFFKDYLRAIENVGSMFSQEMYHKLCISVGAISINNLVGYFSKGNMFFVSSCD